MPIPKRRFSLMAVLILVGAVTLSGCATKSFVEEQIAPIEARVSELESTTDEHAERIDAVDQRAQQGITDARNTAQAGDEAVLDEANQANQNAATADRKAESAQTSADQATNRVGVGENRLSQLNDFSVAETATVNFALESSALSDEAMATLNVIAGQVQEGDFVELHGYTDTTGADGYNIALSHRRAENVKRYLVSRDVALFRIEIVGLGNASPATSNDTREGREQNRRVEINVLRGGN
jgi:outer membrane protein OmpA-like peptidoglycan-associated protein